MLLRIVYLFLSRSNLAEILTINSPIKPLKVADFKIATRIKTGNTYLKKLRSAAENIFA
jgi:hypothetical protein